MVTEYYYHRDNDFVVEVEALTADELDSQCVALLRNYGMFHLQETQIETEEERRELKERARVALDTFHMMFGLQISDQEFLLQESEDEVSRELIERGRELRPSDIEEKFRALMGNLEHELQTIATAHFDDIRGALDIVRSENVAEKSERDLEFRHRVAQETRSLQEEMKRIKMTSIERSTSLEMRSCVGSPSPARILTTPPRQLDPERRETEGERHARLVFESDYPNGVIHLTTSGEGRRCAWEALIGSFAAKFPHCERPSEADFDMGFEKRARDHPTFGMDNQNIFRVDQMATSGVSCSNGPADGMASTCSLAAWFRTLDGNTSRCWCRWVVK